MDPASAGVAFVGFAASLATLAAVVANSSKTLYDLRNKLKDAPEDVRRLIQAFKFLEGLLAEIQARLDEHGDTDVSQRLRELWADSATQMREDLEGFEIVVARLARHLNGHTPSSRLQLRSRRYFDEDAIAKYHQKMSAHTETLTLVQLFMSDRKLDGISNRTAKLVDVYSFGFQAVCSQLVSVDSSNHERHCSQQMSLARIEHILQDQVRISSFEACTSSTKPTTHRRRWRSGLGPTMAAAIFWSYQSYSLPIGLLQLCVSRTRQSRSSGGSSVQESEQSRISISFAPPRWLSSIMLRFAVDFRHNLDTSWPDLSVNLTPFTVNYNPLLPQVIEAHDVAGLQKLFVNGLARPTDYLPGNYGGVPVSIFDMFIYYSHFQTALASYEMYNFLLARCTLTVTEAVPGLFCLFTCYPRINRQSIELYLNSFLASGRLVTTASCNSWGRTLLSTLVSGPAGFNSIRECLSRQHQQLVIEDLEPVDTWLIGILAYVDLGFRKYIEDYLQSFHSPFRNRGRSPSDGLFESAFSIKTIIVQVKNAPSRSRVEFLQAISTSGTSTMLKPFLDAAIDVNERGFMLKSYLGVAARVANLDTFNSLLAAGAKAALAIDDLLRNDRDLSTAQFCDFLTVILAHVTATVLPDHHDPIIKILRSNKALQVCPQAIEVLLKHQVYRPENLHGGDYASILDSFMAHAILEDRSNAVKLFLDHGIEVNVQIGDLYPDEDQSTDTPNESSCSWLTLAVSYGRATCTDILVKHGASILSPDRSGRSALQQARSNAAGKHPRRCHYPIGELFLVEGTEVEDNEILAILENALALTPQPAITEREETIYDRSPEAPSFTSRPRPVSVCTKLLKTLNRHLQALIRHIPYNIRKLSHLSFQDALLMRLGYVISYCTLFTYETVAIIIWLKDLPRPPRAVLPATAVLLLAMIWLFL